jgi:hypothetical protein
MTELTDLDKHILQSTINSSVCIFKQRVGKLYKRYKEGSLDEAHWKSGRKALRDRINHLHSLKIKLDCWEGFGQNIKGRK